MIRVGDNKFPNPNDSRNQPESRHQSRRTTKTPEIHSKLTESIVHFHTKRSSAYTQHKFHEMSEDLMYVGRLIPPHR